MFKLNFKEVLRASVIFYVFGLLYSCKNINPSLMFRTPKDYVFSKPDTITVNPEYKISANDIVTFQLYANDGFKLIDISSAAGGANSGASTITFSIDQAGEAKLPVLGKTLLGGYTVGQAETILEGKFSQFYNKPFVILKVTNKRVTIFTGAASSARVVLLANENTTLFEAMALAGGIASSGKARHVKLIRGSLKNPKIYLIDLNTLEGIRKSDLFVQAGDIIYVDQVPNIVQGVLAQIAPYIALTSNLVSLYTIYYTLQRLGK